MVPLTEFFICMVTLSELFTSRITMVSHFITTGFCAMLCVEIRTKKMKRKFFMNVFCTNLRGKEKSK